MKRGTSRWDIERRGSESDWREKREKRNYERSKRDRQK
jgi:hypothetical protein